MTIRRFARAMVCGALSLGCAAQPASSGDPTQEIVGNLIQAGFPADDIQVAGGKVYAGHDAEVSLQSSREMITPRVAASQEQYRTTNLVDASITTICVDDSAFSDDFSDALDRAINNYNQLGLRFTLRRTAGSADDCSATIAARTADGTGGSAGFPSGGRPFDSINIGTGLTSFSVDTITHVITHEIGHTLGMRHSDFFNRRISCGQGGNEGSAGVGAILIQGTPSGATVGGSIMNSCFRQQETGQFTDSDVSAFTTLYNG